MKQKFITIAILIFTFAQAHATTMSDINELDNSIREASAYLHERVNRGDKVAIVSVRQNFPMLAEYIIENLIENAVNDRSFDVIDRAQLDAVRTELQFQTSGEVSDETALSMGRILGARTIITVTVSQVATMYRFSIRVLDVESAEIRGQVSRNISGGPSINILAGVETTQPQPRVAPPPPIARTEPVTAPVRDVEEQRRAAQERANLETAQRGSQQSVATPATAVSQRNMRTEQNEWWHSLTVGLGASFGMREVDTAYYTGGAFVISVDFDYFLRRLSFIRIGGEFDFAFVGTDNDVVAKKYPDINFDSANAMSVMSRLGINLKLHPTDFFYVSGSVGYGWYGGYYTTNRTNGSGGNDTFTPTMSVGVGLTSIRPRNNARNNGGAFIGAQYHFLPDLQVDNRTVGYWTIKAGFGFSAPRAAGR